LRALVVFVKYPEPGAVKTRLTPFLSPQEAADLYRAFLLDTMVLTGRVDGIRRMMAYAPADALDALQTLVDTPDIVWFEQTGASLGQRLRAAFDTAFGLGAQHVAVIGSDSPILPPALIRTAFDRLDTCDVVLGPASDGGYYLAGVARNDTTHVQYPLLFEDIPWSTDAVYESTVQVVRGCGFSWEALPFWDDVDTPVDLRRLNERIDALRREGETVLGCHTERVLDTLAARIAAL